MTSVSMDRTILYDFEVQLCANPNSHVQQAIREKAKRNIFHMYVIIRYLYKRNAGVRSAYNTPYLSYAALGF